MIAFARSAQIVDSNALVHKRIIEQTDDESIRFGLGVSLDSLLRR